MIADFFKAVSRNIIGDNFLILKVRELSPIFIFAHLFVKI